MTAREESASRHPVAGPGATRTQVAEEQEGAPRRHGLVRLCRRHHRALDRAQQHRRSPARSAHRHAVDGPRHMERQRRGRRRRRRAALAVAARRRPEQRLQLILNNPHSARQTRRVRRLRQRSVATPATSWGHAQDRAGSAGCTENGGGARSEVVPQFSDGSVRPGAVRRATVVRFARALPQPVGRRRALRRCASLPAGSPECGLTPPITPHAARGKLGACDVAAARLAQPLRSSTPRRPAAPCGGAGCAAGAVERASRSARRADDAAALRAADDGGPGGAWAAQGGRAALR